MRRSQVRVPSQAPKKEQTRLGLFFFAYKGTRTLRRHGEESESACDTFAEAVVRSRVLKAQLSVDK